MTTIPGPEGDVRLMPQNMSVFGAHSVPQLDENGQVVQSNDPKAVQNTALAGPQIANILAVVQAIQSGTIRPDAGKALIKLALPAADPASIDDLINPYLKG